MNRYETLLLIRPDVTGDEFSSLESAVERILSESGAKLVSFDRWGKYKLMYPVRKNNAGVIRLVPSVKTFAHGLERRDGRPMRSQRAPEVQEDVVDQLDVSDDVQA